MPASNDGVEVLRASCNLQTVLDGRGGIFTWVPDDAITEFNFVAFRAGAKRGSHYHPEFTEYLLVVAGTGVIVWRQDQDGEDIVVPMSAGQCARIPTGVVHAFHAVTDATAVAMITKPWDDCDVPFIRVEL